MKTIEEMNSQVSSIASELRDLASVLENLIVKKEPNLQILDFIARRKIQAIVYELKDISYEMEIVVLKKREGEN